MGKWARNPQTRMVDTFFHGQIHFQKWAFGQKKWAEPVFTLSFNEFSKPSNHLWSKISGRGHFLKTQKWAETDQNPPSLPHLSTNFHKNKRASFITNPPNFL